MASLALALPFALPPLPSPPPQPLPSPSPSRTPPPSPSPGVSTAAARCTRAAGSRASRTARARSRSCRKRSNRHDWGLLAGTAMRVVWEEGAGCLPARGRGCLGCAPMVFRGGGKNRRRGLHRERECVLLVSVKPCTTCYNFVQSTHGGRCAVHLAQGAPSHLQRPVLSAVRSARGST